MTSHREAPRISKDPAADNTDTYAFVSPDRPDYVTLIANYIPLEEPAGGPNFHNFDDDVRYRIIVDDNGNADGDVIYEFRFRTETVNKNSFLYNTGPITFNGSDYENLNVRQTYSVKRIVDRGDEEVEQVLASGLRVAPANIGPRSTPNYGSLAAAAIHDLPNGGKVFAGPRAEGFAVDLGSAFDLLGLRPLNGAHLIPLDPAEGVNATSGFNVHTLAIQVPITELTRDGVAPGSVEDEHATVGVWANASRRRASVISEDGSVITAGGFRQVSRLGNPLVNEVLIPLGRKDEWNATKASHDSRFVQYFRDPEPARLIPILYPSLSVPPAPRTDIEAIFLTGFSLLPLGLPFTNFTGETRADMLRLNLAVPPSVSPNPLGILGGDLAGFPNGRRVFDRVVEVELRALAGATPFTPAFNIFPNNALGDGADEQVGDFLPSFPYLAHPHQGYSHEHDHS
jgi:hypothetical protein